MIRTFIAIDLPEEMKDELSKITDRLDLKGIKSVERDNFHITLKFLGEMREDEIEKIVKKLYEIDFDPFNLKVCGSGVFPSPKRARIVWIGVKGDLPRMVENIEEKMAEIGFEREKRFHSHITVARVKRSDGEIKERINKFLREYKNINIGEIKIDNFRLKKSTLTKKGPVYETIQEFTSE